MKLQIATGLSRGYAVFDARLYQAHLDRAGVVLSVEFGRLWIDITLLWGMKGTDHE